MVKEMPTRLVQGFVLLYALLNYIIKTEFNYLKVIFELNIEDKDSDWTMTGKADRNG